ncbi:MAG: hypothetical protein ACJA19_000477 [Bacteroidia bacterium]|jgi:hypothetical protein
MQQNLKMIIDIVFNSKSREFKKARQNFNLIFKVKKLKTKYKLLAMCILGKSDFQMWHYP